MDDLKPHTLLDLMLQKLECEEFLSGWNCHNPFHDKIVDRNRKQRSKNKYYYFSDHSELYEEVISFHHNKNEACLADMKPVFGSGSTSLLTAYIFFLYEKGIRELYYVKPIYFTVKYFCNLLKIKVIPVSDYQAYEGGFSLELPNKKTVLLVSDPVWYLGKSISLELVSEIMLWQAKTGSMVMVDGSFQYSKWEDKGEHTSMLDPMLTFRLISPAKSLGIHDIRYAYMLLPSRHYGSYLQIVENSSGATSIDNYEQSLNIQESMKNDEVRMKFLHHIQTQYHTLLNNQLITPIATPDSGYFLFAKLSKGIQTKEILMDGRFFESSQKVHNKYFRVNLLYKNLHSAFFRANSDPHLPISRKR